jgi:hypothetical protein
MGKIHTHTHDCDEYTTVVKGHLIEILNNKTYVEGETVILLIHTRTSQKLIQSIT